MNTYLERASYTWSEDSVRLIHTPTKVAKETFLYVQETGYFKTMPPYFTERKNLDSYLIVYTIAGKGKLRYRGEEYTIEAGETFFIHCMEHHYYECCEGEEWEILWVHFNGGNARGYFEEFVKKGFSILELENPIMIQDTMNQIIARIQNKDLYTELLHGQLLVNILTQLLMQSKTENLSFLQVPSYITKVITIVDQRFKEDIALDEIAMEVGVSKFYLSREFKKYMDTTLNEYVIIKRLNYAKELLKYSQLSVEEIAYDCGINYVSHFINLFKEREKVTPLKYRKEWNGAMGCE